MQMKRMEGFIFGVAVALLPVSLAAQVPMAPTPTTAQSQSGGQIASLSPMDSSANASAGVDTQLVQDRLFVRMATDDGFAEVQFGQLATKKGASDDVKKLGQRLVDDRTLMDQDMQPVADELGVRSPNKMNKADQDEFNKLSALSGTDFDKEYLTYMLRSHRHDLHEFRMEGSQSTDPQLKAAALSLAPVIEGHLYLVNKLALANGLPGAHKAPYGAQQPPRPNPPSS